jgi:alpha-1,2-mannosyltransferase
MSALCYRCGAVSADFGRRLEISGHFHRAFTDAGHLAAMTPGSATAYATESANELYAKLAVAGAVFFVTFDVLYFVLSGLPSWSVPVADGLGDAIGRDYLNTWMGAHAALGAGPAAWFDSSVYNVALRQILPYSNFPLHYWSYPPHVLLFIWPFALIPYFPGYVLWCLIGEAAFLFAASRHGVRAKDLWFLALAPAAAVNIVIGQNGFFTAALLIGGLGLLDRRPWIAGMLFGLLTLKPQLGILLPLMLLITGRWRVIAAAMLTTVMLVAATALLYGPDIWLAYVNKVMPQQAWLMNTTGGILYCMIPSVLSGARFIGLPLNAAWALQWLASGFAVAAVVWTYWRRRDPVLSVAVLITATFVASPYTLTYDMVVLGWPIILLRDRPDATKADHLLALAVWTLPITMLLTGPLRIPLAALLLPAFLGRLIWRLWREARRQAPAEGSEPAPMPAAAAAG